MSDLVTTTVNDGIAHVRLSRPDKLNALTIETLDQLIAAARTLRKDKSLRAVVISGEGDSFCAGLDFATVTEKPLAIPLALVPRPWHKSGTNKFQEACWAWRSVPVPVIAAVHGHCFGGGIQIALAADFRIASPDSEWSVLEGRWGLIPDMSGVQALSELVGIDTAKRLTMTAARITGKEAHDLGLVTDLAADPVLAAEDLARELATKSPDAIAPPPSGSSTTPGTPARAARSRGSGSSRSSCSSAPTPRSPAPPRSRRSSRSTSPARAADPMSRYGPRSSALLDHPVSVGRAASASERIETTRTR